jgi:hypothetical protein
LDIRGVNLIKTLGEINRTNIRETNLDQAVREIEPTKISGEIDQLDARGVNLLKTPGK